MRVAYGSRGLVGLLTPQANTTVEPEFSVLLPPGMAFINARMVSGGASIAARLVDYFDRLDDWAEQFANAPIEALAIACTGASYLVGAARERELVERLSARIGVPVVTSGQAVGAAFGALGAKRVALVSPYPRALTEASIGYWQSYGVEIARIVEVGAVADGFHPIYAMAAQDAQTALAALESESALDAVVMLGTGMPTLEPILLAPRVAGAPVLSCMLATAWRSVLALEGLLPDRTNLLAWIQQPEWANRLRDRLGKQSRLHPTAWQVT